MYSMFPPEEAPTCAKLALGPERAITTARTTVMSSAREIVLVVPSVAESSAYVFVICPVSSHGRLRAIGLLAPSHLPKSRADLPLPDCKLTDERVLLPGGAETEYVVD
jgi:hypothetical protein